ncbi:mas-related G-protein coupled receptor member F [Camelus ferus]|nr:mas-related G-protein coupled receptor member F [Camelus ferus]
MTQELTGHIASVQAEEAGLRWEKARLHSETQQLRQRLQMLPGVHVDHLTQLQEKWCKEEASCSELERKLAAARGQTTSTQQIRGVYQEVAEAQGQHWRKTVPTSRRSPSLSALGMAMSFGILKPLFTPPEKQMPLEVSCLEVSWTLQMCPGVSEAPELYSRGFLTIEQITMLPPPAVMNYIFLLLCLCGLVGNGLVLCKAVFSILNTGGFVGEFADYARAVCRILGLCTFVASVSLLPAISLERCLSVVFPACIHNYFCVFLGHQELGAACRHMDAFLGILLFLVFCPLMRSAKLNHVILAMIPAPFPEYITDLCICINSSAKPVRALRDGAELGEAGGGTPNTVTLEMQCPSGNAS